MCFQGLVCQYQPTLSHLRWPNRSGSHWNKISTRWHTTSRLSAAWSETWRGGCLLFFFYHCCLLVNHNYSTFMVTLISCQRTSIPSCYHSFFLSIPSISHQIWFEILLSFIPSPPHHNFPLQLLISHSLTVSTQNWRFTQIHEVVLWWQDMLVTFYTHSKRYCCPLPPLILSLHPAPPVACINVPTHS